MTKVTLDEWLRYLESRVNIDLYVWGANGESLVELLPKLCQKEKSLDDVDRTLTLLQKRLLHNIDIYDIHCEDCSGLSVRFLLAYNLIPNDMTANGLYDYIVNKGHGKKISLQEVKAGDYLFRGSDTDKNHVGYAINSEYVVESQDHDVGVVITKISDKQKSTRPWKYAARPNWYYDIPEPTKPVLSRELRLTNPYMRGDDVEDAQTLLTEKGYNPGSIDGIFGQKTEKATEGFQRDNNLKADGIIGKNTAIALGFEWAGDY